MDSKTLHEIAIAQQTDNILANVHTWMTLGKRPTWEEIAHLGADVKVYWAKWDQLLLKDGVIYRRWTHATKSEEEIRKLILPKEYHAEVFKMLHEDTTCGHLGFTRTLKRFQDRFYWAGYTDDIRLWCAQCSRCQEGGNQSRKPKAPLKQSKVGAILERVALDILGPLPVSSTGNKYILVIVDYFSRWTEAFALANIEAETITHLLNSLFADTAFHGKCIHFKVDNSSRQFSNRCASTWTLTRAEPHHITHRAMVW